MAKLYKIFIWLAIIPALLCGCNVTRSLKEGQLLLKKNEVSGYNTKEFYDAKNKISYRPNTKNIFGIKHKLAAYNRGYRLKPGKRKTRLMEKKGEPPVLIDTTAINASARNLQQYFFNKGYYNAEVTFEIDTHRKKAIVYYQVELNKPYKINAYKLMADDTTIQVLLDSNIDEALLKKGKVLDFNTIADERTRITEYLNNNGYYYFNKEYIKFKLDTNLNSHEVDVEMQVTNISKSRPHKQQYINTVTVNINNRYGTKINNDTATVNQLFFNYNGYEINAELLERYVFLEPGQLYKKKITDNSYVRLLDLGLFQFIDIQFSQALNPDSSVSDTLMNVVITLTPSKKQEIVLEPQAISSDQTNQITNRNTQTYGLAMAFRYTNKNFLKNADRFDLKYRVSTEAQRGLPDNDKFTDNFNVFEQSITASVYYPKLIFFNRTVDPEKTKAERTVFNLSYIDERNNDFTRTILPANFTYQIDKPNISWGITPAEISYTRTNLKSGFIDSLETSDSIYVRRLFSTNMITASRLSMTYTNKAISRTRSYWFVRWNPIEVGGNLLQSYNNLANKPKNADGQYEVFGVNYFQYVRSDFDVRWNTVFDENNSTVFRVYAGMGVPYGNSNLLPFEKQYFIGGTNSLRAWRPRTVGPGSYTDNSQVQIDRSGEILLQGNFEYRFDIFDRFLEGALFYDAGNVWLRQKRDDFPDGEFRTDKFTSQIAMNTGFGLRFDFTFFILRTDWGIPLKDPGLPQNERWIINEANNLKWFTDKSVFNLGIGYPF